MCIGMALGVMSVMRSKRIWAGVQKIRLRRLRFRFWGV